MDKDEAMGFRTTTWGYKARMKASGQDKGFRTRTNAKEPG